MDLFNPQSRNLLPRDGEAVYCGALYGAEEADRLFNALMEEIDWQHDRVKLYGREIVTKRQVAWHGDAPFQYTYSHNTKTALPWTPSLERIKAEIMLEHGSLLLMRAATQSHWEHSLPVMKRVKTARINLTFRTIMA